jgi:hypothetical protein
MVVCASLVVVVCLIALAVLVCRAWRMADTYQSFDDAVPNIGNGGEPLFGQKSFTKFCFFGFVGSKSWDLTYAVVVGHLLRIYDSEETYQTQPENFVYQLELTHSHLSSMIFSKNYSKDPANEIVIHYCYLLRDNGFWGPTKLLKIGNTNRAVVENFIFQIKRVVKAVRD